MSTQSEIQQGESNDDGNMRRLGSPSASDDGGREGGGGGDTIANASRTLSPSSRTNNDGGFTWGMPPPGAAVVQGVMPTNEAPARVGNDGRFMAAEVSNAPSAEAQAFRAVAFESMVQFEMARLQSLPFGITPLEHQQLMMEQQLLHQQFHQRQLIHQRKNSDSDPSTLQGTESTASTPDPGPPDSRFTTGISKVLASDQDEAEISPYQQLVRKQIELFEQPDNIKEIKQGKYERNISEHER